MNDNQPITITLTAEQQRLLAAEYGAENTTDVLQGLIDGFIEDYLTEEEDDPMAGLSIEDHQRLADAAADDFVELTEVKQFIEEKLAAMEAAQAAEMANASWQQIKIGRMVLNQIGQVIDQENAKNGLAAARDTAYRLYEALKQTGNPN